MQSGDTKNQQSLGWLQSTLADPELLVLLREKDALSGDLKNRAPDQSCERKCADITADWVTEGFALNAETSLGVRPSKMSIRLVPRDPSASLPIIVREIRIYSKDGAAANQALIQLGKSLGMGKGEREPKRERTPRQETTPEDYRRLARFATALADRKEQAEAMKKERENGEQKARSGE